MMTTPVTQEDTQEDHVGDGDSSVHDYDNVPPLAVGCQLMSRTLCSMQSLNLQYTQHVNTYSPLHAQRQVRCSPFESQYKNPVFWSSEARLCEVLLPQGHLCPICKVPCGSDSNC